jgi:hypothetical protein
MYEKNAIALITELPNKEIFIYLENEKMKLNVPNGLVNLSVTIHIAYLLTHFHGLTG